MSENVKAGIAYLILGIFVVGLFYGLIQFLIWDNAEDQKYYEAKCKQIAEVAEVQEYKVVDGECVVIKDGKIVEMK